MKRLILMRHAKSDWSAGLEDHDRPLNPRGVRSARAMGEWLRQRGFLPDEVLCSTATRTRETLSLLGIEATTGFDRALYLAPEEVLLACLSGATGETVLVLGHNPGIGSCAEALVTRAPQHPRFTDYPTCATLVVDFDIGQWTDLRTGSGQTRDFAIPREVLAQ